MENIKLQLLSTYKKVESIFANVKFAVVIISLFTLALVFGTFMESYHGTDYANRLVYKSWWFILIEILMFLSIFLATVVRLPVKKRLYGFYVIHSGLIILFLGSFFTYINGIDGSLQLLPNQPSSTVFLSEDILRVEFKKEQQVHHLRLPYTSGPTNIKAQVNGVEVEEFLPFAEKEIKWVSDESHLKQQHSSQYLLFNENFSEEITLSLSPRSDYKSMEKLGLLTVHYMPEFLAECFTKEDPSGFVIWNLITSECFTPKEKGYEVGKSPRGTRFVAFNFGNSLLKFFPDMSPVAVNDDLTKNNASPFRVLSRDLFKDKPNLFLFGRYVSYYKKVRKAWVLKKFDDNEIIKLPWMQFKIRLLRHAEATYPTQVPVAVMPIQDNGKVIKGNLKAVKINLDGKSFWVRSDGPLQLSNQKIDIRFQIIPKEVRLPYQITLERFKMNTNPGTKDPASYESFVQLLDGRETTGVEKHHVFMNNPLKYDEFTFYQSSYFPVGPGQYGSVFSVNYDPGRLFKYLGSLFIVLGSIWHFIINRKKKKVIV